MKNKKFVTNYKIGHVKLTPFRKIKRHLRDFKINQEIDFIFDFKKMESVNYDMMIRVRNTINTPLKENNKRQNYLKELERIKKIQIELTKANIKGDIQKNDLNLEINKNYQHKRLQDNILNDMIKTDNKFFNFLKKISE